MFRLLTRGAVWVALLSVGLGLWSFSAPSVAAQSPECWEQKEGAPIVTVNPFTGQPITVPSIVTVYDEDCSRITDGRVNAQDLAAEAAIYCTSQGVDIYDLDLSGRGTFAMRATQRDLARVPQNPAENTLIKAVRGFALYRLTTGELQLNGPADWEGKQYVFIWSGC